MNKSLKTILFVLVGILVVGGGYMAFSSPEEDVVENATETVEYTVKNGTISVSFSTDIITEGNMIDVNAPSQDLITKLNVGIGTHVKAGQTLGQFATFTLQQKYNSAMASLNKAVYERNKIDEAEKPDEYKIAQQGVNSAYANLQIAKKELESQTVKAPVSGTVVAISAFKGESVSNGAWITILKDNTFYGMVSLDETEVAKIDLDTPVRVTFDALEKTKLQAEIKYIGIVAQTDNSGYSTYPVKITLSVPDDTVLRTGYEGTISFISKEKSDVLVVPLQAVGREGTTNYVLVKTDNAEEPEKRTVVTGFTDGKNVEISDGLNAGEVILYER